MGADTQSGAEALLRELEQRKLNALRSIEEEFNTQLNQLEIMKKNEIDSIKKSAEDEAANKSQAEANRIIGAAKLEAKRIIFDATEQMLERNLRRLEELLKSYASSDSYKELVLKMANYATKRLGKNALISCRSEDKQLLAKKGFRLMDNELNCIGGIKAYDSDMSVELDLTFEELLRMKEEQIRAAIMQEVS